ncbi:hypothetical protein Mapa_008259 [Marchantia paleacea]|nr:hypothetical protein Mapa_008259 [Marchantia paleacea]
MSITSVDDWDIVDDDGFIFKRRKKQQPSPCEDPDVAEEHRQSAENQQRFKEELARRKKIAMLESNKLKYTAEIEDWQRLLNTEALEIRASDPVIAGSPETLDHEFKEAVDDSIVKLQVQVETYEELNARLKKLCEKGEHMCNMLEKTIKTKTKGLIDEVTLLQNSPRFLIDGLTSSLPAPLGIKALAVSTEVGRLLAQSPV